jgi:hypothetical protein
MAPVLLFLFLMQAVMESLQLRWDDPDSDLTSRPIGFCYMPTAKSVKGQTGCLHLQPSDNKRTGTTIKVSDGIRSERAFDLQKGDEGQRVSHLTFRGETTRRTTVFGSY